jgi:type II secretory pathway pseudopilin PulG
MSFYFKKIAKTKLNQGMSYVELIVVLAIFALMAGISMFSYGTFQGKVDIKNLVNDIALKIVEGQKSATFGQFNSHSSNSNNPNWKPSYGLYFTVNADGLADSKSFNYFTDLNNNNSYDDGTCVPATLTTECLDKILISKGNYISSITMNYLDGSSQSLGEIIIIFTRPNSMPVFAARSAMASNKSYVQITATSPKGISSRVRLYTSGRVEIN